VNGAPGVFSEATAWQSRVTPLYDAHVGTWRDWRYGQAAEFLRRLDPEADAFTFQTFDDTMAKRGALARVLHGDLDHVVNRLEALQESRAGVFVTVAETDGRGRQTHNIQRVRAVFTDLDGAPLATVLTAGLDPHMVVASSLGRFHAYWLCDDCPLGQFERVQRALAHRFAGDPSVHDLARVMRLPGFRHFKGTAQTTRIVEGIGTTAPPYTLHKIVGTLGLKLDEPAAQQPVTADGKIAPGGRHAHLFALGRSMAKRGTSREAVTAALRAENAIHCNPPLPDGDMEYLAERAFLAKNAREWRDDSHPQVGDDDHHRDEHHDNAGRPEVPEGQPDAANAPDADPDGDRLLSDVRTFLLRFVAFPSSWCADAVALWAAHAHMVEHFHTTPRLAALSPEPESGKTRLLEILDVLTPRSMLILSPSVAAIFRKLARHQVTLLFDEVDTIFTRRGKDDQNKDLRALLNAGYRRGASIPRCVGPRHEVQDFAVFAAVALAGIGDLPDTITTRSIVIGMRRRSAGEPVEPYRLRTNESEGHVLRDRLAVWAATVGESAGAAWLDLPDGVADRRAEAWEPLIAIADLAGGDWPKRARVAAVADVAAYRDRAPSLGIKLLTDIRRVFGDRDAMPTVAILESLNALEESPWGDLGGKPLNSRGLATRLKRYGVTSKNVRDGVSVSKGYTRDDLYDAWQRYLGPHPLGTATSATDDSCAAAYRRASRGE